MHVIANNLKKSLLLGGLLLSFSFSIKAQVYERDFTQRNHLFHIDLTQLGNNQYAALGLKYSNARLTPYTMDSTSHTVLEVLNPNLSTDTIYREYGQGPYKCRFNSLVEHNDTLYILTEMALKRDSIQSTKNFGIARVGPNGAYIPPAPLFSVDSVNVYDISKSHLSYRNGFFEFFGWRYDSIEHYYPVLFQFSRGGQLRHYQAWQSDEPRITKLEYLSDYEYLGQGRYLLADEGERDADTYFIADTSQALLKKSFFRNDIGIGNDIVKQGNTYYLFSTVGTLISRDFKEYYAIWRMDSATEQMLPPIFYRKFDTLQYNVFVNPIMKEAALAFKDRLLFGSNMFFSERPGQGNQHLRWGMHMIDTSGNLLWKWMEADSAKSYTSGVNKIIQLDSLHAAVLLNKIAINRSNAHPWIRVFKLDGSTFSLSEQEALGKTLEIFPNPVSGSSIQVRIPFLPDKPVQVQIFDAAGKLQATHTHRERSNLIHLENTLPPGHYLLKVQYQRYDQSAKLLVE